MLITDVALICRRGELIMARPRKWRKVCCLPQNDSFGPLKTIANQYNSIAMTVDEYETIRLIDLEGLNQEECAEKMRIARTTVQRIYSDARKKIAEALVEGKILRIEGGDYKLCSGVEKACGGNTCHRHRLDRCSIEEGKLI